MLSVLNISISMELRTFSHKAVFNSSLLEVSVDINEFFKDDFTMNISSLELLLFACTNTFSPCRYIKKLLPSY